MNKQKIIVAIVFIAALITAFIYRDILTDKELVRSFIEGLGAWAPILFCLSYVIAAIAFIPASFVTVVSGILFGLKLGLVYAAIGTVLGGSFSFIIARYLARDWVKKRSGAILNKVEEGIEKNGWKYVALMRLVPVFPFSILNYAFGLTPIRLSVFAITILFASFPINFIYAYAGYLGASGLGELKLPFLNLP